MTPQFQRFCPLCDRSFAEAEAVLRCEGCGVLYHPACWVRNDGCSTVRDHRRQPAAEAYTLTRSLPAARATGELPPDAPAPAPPPQHLSGQSRPNKESGGGFVIGAEPDQFEGNAAFQPPRRRVPAPYVVADTVPGAPRRYRPPAGESPVARKPLPKLYRSNPVLTYWYIPAAVIVALVVAGGVVLLAEFLFGGDDNGTPATPTSQASVTAGAASGTAQPGGSTSGTATIAATGSSTAVATTTGGAAGGKFRQGQALLVTGTDGCLNVRSAAGTDNTVVACVADGTEVTVLGGPQPGGDLTWWNISTAQGDGWAAEDYLAAKP